MVGILLLMHEPLADAFMTTAMHLFEGEQGRIEAIDVKPDQDICEVNRIAIEAIRRLDDGAGVLVLTDVLGGKQGSGPDRRQPAYALKSNNIQAERSGNGY